MASFGLLSSFSDCGDPGLGHFEYTSQILYDLYPEQDTIKVGDTLWLASKFSGQFTDIYSGKMLSYPTHLSFDISVSEMKYGISNFTPDTGLGEASHKFEFGTVEGSFKRSRFGVFLFPNYENDEFSLKAYFIPKEKGLFILNDAIGRPVISNLSLIVRQSFNVSDVNGHLIHDSFPAVQEFVQGYADDPTFPVKKRVYCFYVKE